jgi:hypothetical protein
LALIDEDIIILASRVGSNWYKKMDNMWESKIPQQQDGDALFNPVTENTQFVLIEMHI